MTTENQKDITIHHILSYSYIIFCVMVFIAIILSSIYDWYTLYSYSWGLTLLVWGTALVIWAQKTSRKTFHREKGNLSHPYFLCGPYRISRTPTHLGLMILTIGLGMMMGYFAVIVSGLLSYLITRYSFVNYQERRLIKLFGDKYNEYKNNVHL